MKTLNKVVVISSILTGVALPILAHAQVGAPCIPAPVVVLDGQPMPAPCVTSNDLHNNLFLQSEEAQRKAATALPSSGTAYQGNIFTGGLQLGSANDACPPNEPWCMSSGSSSLEKAREASRLDPRFNKPVELGTNSSRNPLAGLRDSNSPVLANALNSTIASPATVYLAAIGMTDSGVLAGITGGGNLSNGLTQNMLLAEQNYVQQMTANPAVRDFNISTYYRCIAEKMGAFRTSAAIATPKDGWMQAVSKCQGGERTGITGDGTYTTGSWNPPSSTQIGRLPATYQDRATHASQLSNMTLYNSAPVLTDTFNKQSVVDEIINANFSPLITTNPDMIAVAKDFRESFLNMFGDIEWRDEAPGDVGIVNTSYNNSAKRQSRRTIEPKKGLGPYANAMVREWYVNMHRVLYMYCKFQNGENIPSGNEMGSTLDPALPPTSLSYRRDNSPYDWQRAHGESITAANLRADFFNEILRDSWKLDPKERMRSSILAKLSTPTSPMTAQFIMGLWELFAKEKHGPTTPGLTNTHQYECDELKVWDTGNPDNYYSVMNATNVTMTPSQRAFQYMAAAKVMGQSQLLHALTNVNRFLLKASETAEGSIAAEYGRSLIAAQLGTLRDPMEMYASIISTLPGDIQNFLSGVASRGGSNLAASYAIGAGRSSISGMTQ